MPVIDYITISNHTSIITWDVSETNEELLHMLNLSNERVIKYENLKPKQAREYLGLRACLKRLGLDYDVNYNEKGKPYLPTGKEISITHSYGKVAVAVSDYFIGIDIELARPTKISNIKDKFINPIERKWLPEEGEAEYLHIIWGIKEGLYKINGGNLWNFLNHYHVDSFCLGENKPIICWIFNKTVKRKYLAHYKKLGEFYLIWVLDYE